MSGASARGIRGGEAGRRRQRGGRTARAALSLPALCRYAARGQNGELPHDKRASGFSYSADHPVDERRGVHFEGSYRPM